MRVRLILLLFLGCWESLSAQSTVFETNGISNDTVIIDFGKVRESQKSLDYQLTIKNIGEYPGKLLKFETSCDCITSKIWDNKALAPGEIDTLDFNISIDNRPGALEKTITITTDGNPKKITHIIKGYIIPSFESVEQQYPYKSGQLWFELRNKFISVGNINDKDTLRERVHFYNASIDTLKLNYTQGIDSSLLVQFEKRVLPPKQGSHVDITYYPSVDQNYGHVKKPLIFYTSEKLYPKKELYFHAFVMPELSSNNDSLPKFSIDTTLADFGKVSDSISVDLQLGFTNEGTIPLQIKQLKTNCPCIKVNAQPEKVMPGEKAYFNIVLDPRKRIGELNKMISVFTNDPENPVLVIDVNAIIISP